MNTTSFSRKEIGAAVDRAAGTVVGRAVGRAARRSGAALKLDSTGKTECKTEVGRPESCGES